MPTIGVSVAVPEPWGSELQQYRIDLGDEQARHIPTHVTLLPPLEVEEEQLEGIVTHLARAAADSAPYRLHLRGTGTFRPVSPVVFLNVVEGIGGCESLAAAVRTGPLRMESRFPYHPHVTVAHDQREAILEQAFVELERYDAAFDVDRMWMYLHDPVSGWQQTHSFLLGSTTGEG